MMNALSLDVSTSQSTDGLLSTNLALHRPHHLRANRLMKFEYLQILLMLFAR